ncbi:MAG: 2-phospho-L-lactate transferase [Emcibacter sp.]|nr:2-phospho-L-lactate transferase [Emcibacter sp.]
MTAHYLALSGGVGGAKLALGLSKICSQGTLSIVTNTCDDFTHLGLYIAPDLDTVMYTLADVVNTKTGWGRADESWNLMNVLKTIGGESWFLLGDKDMAVHIERTNRLNKGESLSAVTQALTQALNIEHAIVPMTDDRVQTMVTTELGEMAFQHYFVREGCQPKISSIRFDDIENARPSPAFTAAIADPELAGVILCPSNPFVSIDPILHIPGVRDMLNKLKVPIVAISPIVKGLAIKGPAAKMLQELGKEASVYSIARHYKGLINGLIIDTEDAPHGPTIEAMGIRVKVTNTIMKNLDDRKNLAATTLQFIQDIQHDKL